VLALVVFNDKCEQIEVIGPRCAQLRFLIEVALDLGQRGLIVGLIPERADHFFRHDTVSGSIRSWSAWVPMNFEIENHAVIADEIHRGGGASAAGRASRTPRARRRTWAMPRGVKSASSSPRSKRKRSALGRRLIDGLDDALAHARGELNLPSYTVRVPKRVDVARCEAGSGSPLSRPKQE